MHLFASDPCLPGRTGSGGRSGPPGGAAERYIYIYIFTRYFIIYFRRTIWSSGGRRGFGGPVIVIVIVRL